VRDISSAGRAMLIARALKHLTLDELSSALCRKALEEGLQTRIRFVTPRRPKAKKETK
jgi:hypothetical protein